MANEVTMICMDTSRWMEHHTSYKFLGQICMDTSRWMEHHTSYKFLGQIDAIGVYYEKYFKSHPENYVGVLAMGGKYHTRLLVEPTKDLSLIMSTLRGFANVSGDTLLVTALMTGSSHLIEEHEKLLKRLVVFAGGPLCDYGNHYTKLGTTLKERGVAVDVVNFGAHQDGYKKHQLLVLLTAVNNNDNTRMLDLCAHQLNGSSITPLVGQGETSLYAVYLLQGEYLQTAKNQCDKVHGDSNVAIGYFFRKPVRVCDERRLYRVGDRRKVRDWDIGKDIPLDDDDDDDARKDRYWDRGDRYGQKRVYRVCNERRLYRVGDRRKVRDWDIGKDIPLDDDDDAGKDRYWDRGDRYGRKRVYGVRDEGRERYRVGDRRKLKRDDDAGRKERCWDRGDSFHDLKADGGIYETRNRKRKRDDTGHDDGREIYRDRGDRYGRKRYYKGHDEGRERYR